MDKQRSEPVTRVPKETLQSWCKTRVMVCWLTFGAAFVTSSLISLTLFAGGREAGLLVLGCLAGSLLAAPVIVYLAEQLTGGSGP